MSDQPTPGRDDRIASALHDLPIPDHGPTFWADLDRALAEPSAPAATADAFDHEDDAGPGPDVGVHRLDTGELPSVTALAPGRTARRSRRAPFLAAAAAVVLLTAGVGLVLVAGGDGDGDGGEAELADGESETTTLAERTDSSEAATTTRPAPPTATSATAATLFAAAPGSPEEAVDEWLLAVGTGDTTAAATLTGPRTTAYLEAATDGVDAYLRESAEGYGAWSGAPDIEVDVLQVGPVASLGGELAIVVVSGTNPGEGREGPTVDVFPVVDRGAGWQVEHLAFDAARDTNEPIIQIPRAPQGLSGLGSMSGDEAVEVIVPAAGTVVFRIDDLEPFSRQTTGVGDNDDPYARYDPNGTLPPGDHILVVVGVGEDGTVSYTAGSFAVTR